MSSEDRRKRERDIFEAALEHESAEERERCIERLCEGDSELLARVRALLKAYDASAGLFSDAGNGSGAAGSGDGDGKKQGEAAEVSAPGVLGPGGRLGDFVIIREVARGGMGVVYEARQVSLNRKVALKVLAGALCLTPKAVRRFHLEARAAARLHHTNIVPVYATGHQNGVYYYVMELIDGPSLDQVIRRLRQNVDGGWANVSPAYNGAADTELSGSERRAITPAGPTSAAAVSRDSQMEQFDAVAGMIAGAADALDHAHAHGVIHRDIKPANLLLGPDGRISVNDFGLARMREEPGLTMTGEFFGTPAYMSPEQITAGRTPLDHRSDIYSLGATLYEMLTHQPPFAGEQRDQVLAKIIHKEPKRPTRLNKRIPRDLETICLKAMEKDPDRRYQTAGAMAEDLRRYLNRYAILARRAGPVNQVKKWMKRHPGLTAGLACAAVALAAAGYFGYGASQTEQARAAAQQTLLNAQMDWARDQLLQGNFEAAEAAIGNAEELGAPMAWSGWRRGQLAYHRGEIEEAIALLEPAAAEMEENVSARALLPLAYAAGGLWYEAQPFAAEVEVLQPETSEDVMYKGAVQAMILMDPVQGLETLDRAIAERVTLIALVLRAEVRARSGLEADDTQLADGAVRDAEAAKTLGPDNPSALVVSVFAHQAAAALHGRPGRDAQRAAVLLANGRRDVDALARFPHMPAAVLARGRFLEFAGEEDAAMEVWRTAARWRSGNAWTAYYYISALGRRGDLAAALEFADGAATRGRAVEVAHAVLLAEFPERHEEALGIIRAAAAGGPEWPRALDESVFHLMLGQSDEAAARAQAAAPRMEAAARPAPPWAAPALAYLADPSPAAEAEFLAAAGPFKSSQLVAHAFIGLGRLSDGDRAGARESFEQAVGTRCFNLTIPYELARLCLARMDQDPAWPPWIPAGG